ncbi:SDR family NAD(P)-dependent oxidoreductase [Pseudomonadales bacterium]|nr:SDR family NAD(P)-dependent oxidoreductase [Pseudomonadales bacterium]
MSQQLAQKVAVITGGTSGIGEATAECFVAEGAQVVICGRSIDKGEALAERLGEHCRFIQADVTQEADIERTLAFALEQFGGLDILFNNAGGPTRGLVDSVEADAILYATELLFSSAALGRTTLDLFFQNHRQSHHAVYLTHPDHGPALVQRKLKPCQ